MSNLPTIKDSIIKSLKSSTLTLEELREIKKNIDLQIYSLVGRYSPSRTVDLFYSTVSSYLYDKFRITIIPLRNYEQSSAKKYDNLIKAHDYINDFFKTVIDREPGIIELKKLYTVYTEMMCDYFLNLPTPPALTVGIVLNNYESFPGVVARHMPNYIESGLFKALLNTNSPVLNNSIPTKPVRLSDKLCPKGGVHVIIYDKETNITKCGRCGELFD